MSVCVTFGPERLPVRDFFVNRVAMGLWKINNVSANFGLRSEPDPENAVASAPGKPAEFRVIENWVEPGNRRRGKPGQLFRLQHLLGVIFVYRVTVKLWESLSADFGLKVRVTLSLSLSK